MERWVGEAEHLDGYRTTTEALLQQLHSLSKDLLGLGSFVSDLEEFHAAVKKPIPNDVLARVHRFAPGAALNTTLPQSELLTDRFLAQTLGDAPEELLDKVRGIAGGLSVVPNVVRPWLNELREGLPLFEAAVGAVDEVQSLDVPCPQSPFELHGARMPLGPLSWQLRDAHAVRGGGGAYNTLHLFPVHALSSSA